MGNSTGRAVHIDVPLSNVALGYKPMGMIAADIAPVVIVPKQSDAYYEWNQADAYRVDDTRRGPGDVTNQVTRSANSATFFCHNYALSDFVPVEDMENADPGWLLTEETARIEYLYDKLALDWEKRIGLKVTSSTNVGSSDTVNSAWTDHNAGNSDPIGDINTAINNVYYATGYRPNMIVFGIRAWDQFKEHADVIDRVWGTTSNGAARFVAANNAAALFEVDKVLVGGAFYNTADEGQTISLTDIWGDNILVYYSPMTPARNKPAFSYTFRWEPTRGLSMQAKKSYDEDREAEKIKLGMYQDEKITGSNFGFLIRAVNSAQ